MIRKSGLFEPYDLTGGKGVSLFEFIILIATGLLSIGLIYGLCFAFIK